MDLPRSIRMSTSGSAARSSNRANGMNTRIPAPTSAHGHHAPAPLRRMKVSPDVMSSSPRARSVKPRVSTRPPLRSRDSGTPNLTANQHAETATAGTRSTSCSWPGEHFHERAGGERPGDDTGFQRPDEDAGRAPGAGGAVGQLMDAAEDQGNFQRQPDHVETLERPRGQEGPEVRGERDAPGGHGGDQRGNQQDLLVPVHVPQLGQHRHGEGADHELRGLEPVDVGVVDPQVPGDIGEDGRVIALQDSTGELHQTQKSYNTAHGGLPGGRAPRGQPIDCILGPRRRRQAATRPGRRGGKPGRNGAGIFVRAGRYTGR